MHNRFKALILIIIAFSLIAVAGCSNTETPNTPDPAATTDAYPDPSAYPPPAQPNPPVNNAYPGAETPTAVPITVEPAELPLTLPQPETGMATLGGVVIDEQTRQAPPESLLFLGEVVYTDTGMPIISVDRQNDPVIVLQPNGTFVFENVMPGEYGIVFFTPDYSFLLENAESGESLMITLESDQVLDIGLFELAPR